MENKKELTDEELAQVSGGSAAKIVTNKDITMAINNGFFDEVYVDLGEDSIMPKEDALFVKSDVDK